MSFVLATSEIRDGKKIGKICIKGLKRTNNYAQGKNLLIFKGETYPYSLQELFNDFFKEGIDIVKKLKGEFFIIIYNNDSNNLYIANDRLGRETLFYFYDHKKLIISDDFWEIIKIIEPKESDVDTQSVKELVIFYYPLFYKTIIKNLDFLPNASIGEFSLINQTLKLKQYWDFRLQIDNSLTVEEAVQKLDQFLDSDLKQIKDQNDPCATYGIGLSGGLDTRLIPYYALKNGIVLKSFVIGKKRPHRFALSRSHKNAKALAKYYGLNHYEVESASESFEDKSFYDVRHFPIGPSQFFKINVKDIPKFDILLTGALGELVGGAIRQNIMQLNNEELLDEILTQLTCAKSSTTTSSVLKKGFNYVFQLNTPSTDKKQQEMVEEIMSNNEFTEAINKIRNFIKEESNKSNIEIFQKYWIFHLGSKNKYGAYESLQGQRKSYSIYYPFVLDELLTWKPDFFIDRKILKSLLLTKFPKLAKIPLQDYRVPIFYSFNRRFLSLRRIRYLLAYIIRGSGFFGYGDCPKMYDEYSNKILSKNNEIFDKIFDKGKIVKLRQKNIIAFDNLLKVKLLLDIIQNKGYKQF